MMADFVVKLPVFQLGEKKRGALLAAKVRADGYAEVTLLCDDRTTVMLIMPMSRVTESVKRGPYVVLVEAKDVGGEMVRGVGIVGPDGRPL